MAVKRRLFHSLLSLSALCLSACAVNLGSFDKSDDYESYYDALGDVKCLYDGGDATYDVKKSLFNKTTTNKLSWDEGTEVSKQQYLYIIVPFEEDLKLEAIIFYVTAEVNLDLTLSLFYFENEDQAPKNIKYLTSPDEEIIYDDDGNPIGTKEIEYDDPPVEKSIVHGSRPLNKGAWQSFVLGNFKQTGFDDGMLHVKDGGYLYIRAENNSGWNRLTLTPITFSFINLMMRSA